MLWHKKPPYLPGLVRTFRNSCILHANHYDELEISSKATQSDIKAAYYKLSKVHHPDKSKTEASAKKFRAITEAYEVLGNVQLKKMYDKGLIVGRDSHRMDYKPEPEPTDPNVKFHKSRGYRNVVPTMDGRTPIYNFDAWSKMHYGDVFQKTVDAKVMNKIKMEKRQAQVMTRNEETFIYMVFALVALFAFIVFNGQTNYDINSVRGQTHSNHIAVDDKIKDGDARIKDGVAR